jgi:hypothetical protein
VSVENTASDIVDKDAPLRPVIVAQALSFGVVARDSFPAFGTYSFRVALTNGIIYNFSLPPQSLDARRQFSFFCTDTQVLYREVCEKIQLGICG